MSKSGLVSELRFFSVLVYGRYRSLDILNVMSFEDVYSAISSLFLGVQIVYRFSFVATVQ